MAVAPVPAQSAPMIIFDSPKAVSAASAPMVVVPSPRASAKAAEKAAALEKLIAKTREILAVRRVRAIGATAAAQSAKAHKSPSAAEKLEVARLAVAKFKAVKSTLEKASARAGALAAQSAPMVVVAKGIRGLPDVKLGPAAYKGTPSIILAPVVSPSSSPKAKSASSWGAPSKGKSSDSWSSNVVMKDDIPVGQLDWGESPKAKSASSWGAPSKGKSSDSWSSNVVMKDDIPVGQLDWGESPKAKSASLMSSLRASAKAASPKAKISAKLRARGASAMGGPKSRKRSDPLLELEKQIEAGVRKEKRLERYHRLIREGRRKEAMRYMRKHNMLHEVMDMSHVLRLEDLEKIGSPSGLRGKSGQPAKDLELEFVDLDQYGSPLGSRGKSGQPAKDLELEVVDFEPYGSSPKKRSSSGSRKRSSGKSSDSRSRKQGASFGKMAEALKIQAKKDAAFRPASFKEPPKPVARASGAVAGKNEDSAVAELHKKVVNLATSPTFKPHNPAHGRWAG